MLGFVISFNSLVINRKKKFCKFNLPFTSSGFKYLFIFIVCILCEEDISFPFFYCINFFLLIYIKHIVSYLY